MPAAIDCMLFIYRHLRQDWDLNNKAKVKTIAASNRRIGRTEALCIARIERHAYESE